MEEDPESEWEIQEFSSLKEGDQSETSMVKWILKKGYGIGKKMVITGIVISSAPVVLPPLVVFSAIGVAVSVPFGLVFASYACTNKLMNMLLPTPTQPPPLLLEYYEDDFDEKVPNLDQNGSIKQCFSIDEYEYEDDGRNVGVEIEFDGSRSNEIDGFAMNVDEKGYYSDVDERIDDIEEGVAVRFEEDEVDENVDESLGRYSDEVEEENERRIEDSKEGDKVCFELDDVDVYNVDKERNDTNEIDVKKGRKDDEEKEQMEDMNQGVEIIVRSFDVAGDKHNMTDEGSIRKLGNEKPSVKIYDNDEEVSKEEEEEIVKESTGLLEKIRNEDGLEKVGDSEHTSNGVFEKAETPEEPVIVKEIESRKLVVNGNKNVEPVGEMRHVVVLAQGNEENNFSSREVEELDLVARKVLGDTDGSEDAISRENLVRSNAGAREISDENGGGDKVTGYAADENIDVMARRAFKRAPLDSDHAKIASKTDKKVPFRKDVLNDEKIWEKIEAMRAIVGFKAPRQPTCIDELKALYVFTGVEPPASFKDDSNLVDVNAKLKFLMSIVGVR